MSPAAHQMTDADHADTESSTPESDLRAAGERIEMLLDASSAHGAMARERSEELVRLVADLYGAGLGRILDIVHDCGRLDGPVLDALAADDLVASLLLVHGLHPYDVDTRIERALDEVRPYLGTHGGDVELLGVTEAGVVRLRLLGSCDGCASSSVTLKLAVEGAVEAAAPEITGIEVDTGGGSATGTVIPLSALRVRLDELDAAGADGEAPGSAWHPVPEPAAVADGEVRGLVVAGAPVVVARVGPDLFAYRDGCPVCTGGLGGTVLARRLGGAVGEAVLRCPTCRTHFDVRRAGAALDGDRHLEPLPLLVHDDVVSLALPTPGPVRA
jgi:Fe-S cluster biogenesis protein NfuA/nitrite reductase/ring-hydroxylating ferredoxin subunit